MKVEGWEVALAAELDAVRSVAFVWGVHDCATWAFDVRRVLIGGGDVAAAWRGKYKSAAGAARVMRRLGWANIEAASRVLLGDPLPTPLLAQRGDVLLAGVDPALGICAGANGCFLAPEGLTEIPLTDCAIAWRI